MATAEPMQLMQRYQDHLKQSADTLRQRFGVLKEEARGNIEKYKEQLGKVREEMQPKAKDVVDQYKVTVTDVNTPVDPAAPIFLMQSYLWTAVCMTAFTMGRLVGSMLSAPFGMVFNTLSALLLTYVAWPAFVYLGIRKIEMAESQREQAVMFSSIVEGVLIGALFSEHHMNVWGPPAMILPLIFGLTAYYVGGNDSFKDHKKFVGVLLGAAVMGYVAFGLMVNFGLNYVVYTALVCAAAFVDLQLKLATVQTGKSSPQLEQWKTVVAMTVAISIAEFVLSTSYEVAHQAKAVYEAHKSK